MALLTPGTGQAPPGSNHPPGSTIASGPSSSQLSQSTSSSQHTANTSPSRALTSFRDIARKKAELIEARVKVIDEFDTRRNTWKTRIPIDNTPEPTLTQVEKDLLLEWKREIEQDVLRDPVAAHVNGLTAQFDQIVDLLGGTSSSVSITVPIPRNPPSVTTNPVTTESTTDKSAAKSREARFSIWSCPIDYSDPEQQIPAEFIEDASLGLTIPFCALTPSALTGFRDKPPVRVKNSRVDFEKGTMTSVFELENQYDLSLEEFRYAVGRWLEIQKVILANHPDIYMQWEELFKRLLRYPDLEEEYAGWIRVITNFVRAWNDKPSAFTVASEWTRLQGEVNKYQQKTLAQQVKSNQAHTGSSTSSLVAPSAPKQGRAFQPYTKNTSDQPSGTAGAKNFRPTKKVCFVCGAAQHSAFKCPHPTVTVANKPCLVECRAQGVLTSRTGSDRYCLFHQINGCRAGATCTNRDACSLCNATDHGASSGKCL